jgi:hypothetical protein
MVTCIVTCIECRSDIEIEKHREGCNVPAVNLLKQMAKLQRLAD